MADVTGPVSTLPGSVRGADGGSMCDDHPKRKAFRRVQGETDSFGAEFHDLCEECFNEFMKHAKEALCGRCDWCKSESNTLRHMRDYEEGACGPIYQVCQPCRRDYFAQLNEED
jgi:hypothetical protein